MEAYSAEFSVWLGYNTLTVYYLVAADTQLGERTIN